MADTTNETENLKSGPITPEEVTEWENALSDQDKLQLRRLQLQQASISRASPDTEPDWGAVKRCRLHSGDVRYVRGFE
jgi:hypothetical protein